MRTRFPTLICLPYAGGHASFCRGWSLPQHEGFSVFPVEYPGRGKRFSEPPLNSMAALVADVHRQIEQRISEPYVLFGHSLGALVGHSLIAQLRQHGGPLPARFIASGCRAPHLAHAFEGMHRWDDARFIEALAALGGTPRELLKNPEFFGVVSRALRADFELADHRAALPCVPADDPPLSIFYSADDEVVSFQSLLEWKEHFQRPEFHEFDGNHFFIHSDGARLRAALIEIVRSART